MTQSVKLRTLDSDSGHDLRVGRPSPASGSVLGVEPAKGSLSPSPLPSPAPPSLINKCLYFEMKLNGVVL